MYPATNGVEAAHHGACASEGSLDSILHALQSLPSGEGLLPKIGMSHAGVGTAWPALHPYWSMLRSGYPSKRSSVCNLS